MPEPSDNGRRNRILSGLPEDVYGICRQLLEPVDLEHRQSIYEADRPIERVYFPLTAVVSLITPMADGSEIEAAIVGNEGVVGLPVFLGASSIPMTAFAQVPGRALRMDADAFRELLADTDGPLSILLQRYAQTMFTQLAQNVACNRLHSVEQRCARWLLMTADRVDAEQFPLTQEFLAHMLGVRRASVTEVAGRLAQSGCIRSGYGSVTVLDRHRLEQASCECYQVISSMITRMLGDSTAAGLGDRSVPSPR
jgi:CRP-like cAMP-binding protein